MSVCERVCVWREQDFHFRQLVGRINQNITNCTRRRAFGSLRFVDFFFFKLNWKGIHHMLRYVETVCVCVCVSRCVNVCEWIAWSSPTARLDECMNLWAALFIIAYFSNKFDLWQPFSVECVLCCLRSLQLGDAFRLRSVSHPIPLARRPPFCVHTETESEFKTVFG